MSNSSKEKKLKSGRISVKPFVYNIPSISSVSIRFIILLSLQIIMLGVTKSYSALIVILATLLGALAASAVNYFISKEPLFNIMNIAIQGLLVGLLLPEQFPPFTAFVISFSTIVVSRCIVFKGINNWLNTATIAVIIAWFVGRNYFPNFEVSSGLLSLRNTSVYLLENGTFPIYSFDSSITSFLNKYIFDFFKITIPEGFISLFWDSHSIIPAFRFNLLTIISSIIIFSDNAFSLIIPSIFLLVYATLVRLFVPFLFGGNFNQGDIILALLTSGVLFCCVFLIQWYGTIPVTVQGKILLGVLSGFTAFLIIGCGTSPVGMVYTVLLSNIISMVIRVFEERHNELVTGKVITKYSAKITAEQEAEK